MKQIIVKRVLYVIYGTVNRGLQRKSINRAL